MNIFVAVDSSSENFKSFFDSEAVLRIKNSGKSYFADHRLSEEELASLIDGYDACITCWGSPPFSEAVLKNASSLKYIVHTCGSVSSIVNDAVYDRGITVLSGNDFFAHSVAEGVIAYILSALRYIPRISENLRINGKWDRFNLTNNYARSLLGKTVGLISFGAITKYLIPMLAAFDCKIKLFSRQTIEQGYLSKYNAVQTDIDSIFKTCDIVSIHTALNEHTKNMITKKQLSLLKDGAVFVNTARGGVVCEDDLISEILTGRISAVLDVYHREPLEASSPLIGRDNVFLMPHMAGPTIDLRKKITHALLDSLERCEKGEKSPYEISRKKASEMTDK